MTARADFMRRLRAEMARTPGLFTAAPSPRPARPRERVELLRRELAERWPATLEQFRAELERVGGVFYRVPTAAEVPAVIGGLARARGFTSLVSWHEAALGAQCTRGLAAFGLDVQAMPAGVPAMPERDRLRAVVAAADLGLTGVDLAIAETGTLVLLSGAGRPRTTSLLPTVHVAVFDKDVLVESLEQVGLFLEAWHEGEAPGERGAVINFITGPSRTADIELTLTRGVHGPKEVHVIFVEQGVEGAGRG
ncbi:MAG TPA: lactate utilization protein [Candidatus Limnocylindria bacterium]|nr:lactate utilization protein [Candidatus Limnocylindria bacterium]